jgi:quercetin dioxygenase-like cupin family protein
MEIETLKTESPVTGDRSLHNSTIFTFDLPTLIDNIKHSHSWVKGELNAMILLNRPEKQIVLALLPEKTEISSFQKNDSVTIQVIEGSLRFHTRKKSVPLCMGQLLTLHENIRYRLTTNDEAVFLLTITNGTIHMSEN